MVWWYTSITIQCSQLDVWKTGKFDAAKLEMWFKKDLELDKKIREEYGEEIRNISNDENRLADLQSDPDVLLYCNH